MIRKDSQPMNANGDSPESTGSGKPQDSSLRILQWIAVALVGLTAVTLGAAHAPGRVRLLGLFAVAFGAACGWGLARAALAMETARGRWAGPVMVAVLIASAEIGLTLESWRLYIADRRREYFEDSAKKIPKPLQEAAMRELRPIFERETRLEAYLLHRVKNLGEWASPWPMVFWLVEVLLGTAAGTAVFAGLRRNRNPDR